MPNLFSRAQFSREAGVSDVAISKWCRGPGADACIGKRIDRDHPLAVAYLASKGVATTAPAAGGAKRERKQAAVRRSTPREAPPPLPSAVPKKKIEIVDLDKDFEQYADLTLREFVKRHGSAIGAKDFLDALKKIVDIHEKDLKNAETEGLLIERDLVKTHVFGAIEAANRRLLGDSPKTITRRLYAAAKSDMPIEEAEKVVREIISSQLKPVKDTAARVLRNA